MALRLSALVLLSTLSCLDSAFQTTQTEKQDVDGYPIWKISGDGAIPGGGLLSATQEGQPRLTDHIHKDDGDDALLNQKMTQALTFFNRNLDQIQQVLENPNPEFISAQGWRRSEGTAVDEVSVEVSPFPDDNNLDFGGILWNIVQAHRATAIQRVMISFQRRVYRGREQWFITHWGPFGQPTWDNLDVAMREFVRQKRQGLADTIRPPLENAYNNVYDRILHDQINNNRGPSRGVTEYNQAIDLLRHLGWAFALPRALQFFPEAVPEGVIPLPHAVPQLRERQPAPGVPLPSLHQFNRINIDRIERSLLQAANIARLTAAQTEQVRAHAHAHRPENRKRRSSETAKLELSDADFKEKYGDNAETHAIYFKRKAFIRDLQGSGRKLRAERLSRQTKSQ